MPQTRLGFRTTRSTRSANPKNVLSETPVVNEKIKTLQTTGVESPGSKRKHVSSPECSPSVDKPPKTGHSRVKRLEKRSRTAKNASASKTLIDFLGPSTKKEADPVSPPAEVEQSVTEPLKKSTPVEVAPTEQVSTVEKSSPAVVKCNTPAVDTAVEEEESLPLEPVKETAEKAVQKSDVQKDVPLSAKMLFKKLAAPRERVEPAVPKKTFQTTGGRMVAAALAKRREGVPAHKNEVIRALAAKRELCTGSPKKAKAILPPKPANSATATPPKETARSRFAHLIKPTSPKLKPFTALNITSPSKSPSKLPTGLSLPESFKRLHDKFNTSDQVVNLLARRSETCTFQKLQKNVQEICRKRYEQSDLAHIVGVYKTAYLLAQCKGLSQIRDGRMIRNEYQLTIAFNYAETEAIKQNKTTDIFALHPSLPSSTTRKLEFSDSNKLPESELSSNEQIDLQMSKEKHAANQRGLLTAELLERNRRFGRLLLAAVRDAHRAFLDTLVPVLSIKDDQLVRWHPGFDLNGLELPAPGKLPEPPISSKLLSASEMLQSVDSNKAAPPPGMQEAVNANMKKVLEQRKEEAEVEEKKKEDQLAGVNKDLVARIRAKEAKKLAEKMVRDPEKDKELAMLGRCEVVVRCLRVLYISAGKGCIPLADVTQDISDNPRVNMSAAFAEDHIRLLLKVAPEWLSTAQIRKKHYLKLNRNLDTNRVVDAIRCRQALLQN